MTDLWLHVNTFFIIVLIFFRYGSHIKKYMVVFFICLRKLSFCGAGAFKFVLWFLKFFLPGTVKAAPTKLCAVFLCTLLKRLQFSPKNVGFWTKKGKSALSGAPEGTPPVAYGDSPLGDGAFGMTVRFPAKVQSLRVHQRLPLRGSWQSRQALTEGVRSKPHP